MYQYDALDKKLLNERVAQFRGQTQRYLAGELDEEEFRPLRLQNGLYIQRLAPMLRIAVPYGLLSSAQVRRLAEITRKYDKSYAHVSTRQNLQLNWPKLEDVPDILAELAEVEMHAIQTSGNCIRNTTTDQLAGVAADEIEDPRPTCEIIRQWSTLHPEYAYLPRKFKIAVSASRTDRAATQVHDIGVHFVENPDNENGGERGFAIYVGGGLGRLPHIGKLIRDYLPREHLLSYLDAVLRVYNRLGRRDNKHKARIKILVNALGKRRFTELVEAEWNKLKDGPLTLTEDDYSRMAEFFPVHSYDAQAADDLEHAVKLGENEAYARWCQHNLMAHKQPGYHAVVISLKPFGEAPGDISDAQLDAVADLADQYSFGEVRNTHDQNMVLADVKQADLFAVWQALDKLQLATPNIGTINDMICCPGLDFCSLANAGSIGIAKEINQRFDNLDYLYDLGEIKLKMSGCMNGCGHHSVGHIGILGVDKKGDEWYQIMLGGSSTNDASIGDRIGASLDKTEVVNALEKVINVFVEKRDEGERFLDTYRRIGIEPFRERVYPQKEAA